MKEKEALERIAKAVGVTINGPEPTDPQIYDDSVYRAFLSHNSLAIGETFMDKKWDCDDLAGLYTKILKRKLQIKKNLLSDPKLFLRTAFSNLQAGIKAFEVGEQHYDLGNDLYEAMLDRRMVYTSAIYDGAYDLDSAQEIKLERICRKLGLKRGDRVLDIGCGWGSFMKYAAQKYGVSCVGLTVSKEQTAWGRKSCEGLPIEFVITDYRDYVDEEKFDHIVSIEMIEAVGQKNLRTYFKKANELLKDGGTFMLQAIISPKRIPVADPWIDKYIFPNGVLVSPHQLEKHTRGLFHFADLRDIGPDYDPTLMAWWQNFDIAYEELRKQNERYDERFYRMWKYYLQMCAALFRSRELQDWQLLLRKA